MANNINIGDSKVLESRETRRRRVTPEGRRFTTYERIEMPALVVKKRSGNREQFDRDKLLTAVRRSVGKFFNSDMEVEDVVNKVVERVYDLGQDEIESKAIGQAILDVLASVNEVAYVRFASVFLEFKTLEDFENIIRSQREQNNK